MSKKKNAEKHMEEMETMPVNDGAVDAEETAETVDVNALKAELEKAQAQSEEYLSMAQRVQADFENFRRRNNSVRAESFEDGARTFIKTILPVIDNLGDEFLEYVKNGMTITVEEDGTVIVE